MADLKMKLTPNFSLGELVRSSTAERDEVLKNAQENPPVEIINSLSYLANIALQPIRERLNFPIRISSGYRSPEVNDKVGGSSRSQHVHGQAADLQLSPSFLTSPNSEQIRNNINAKVLELTGRPIRPGVNANFYLFAYVVINLDRLDIDQAIHEYGGNFGEPAWVHISASKSQDKRMIMSIGTYTKKKYEKPSVVEALAYGT